MDHRRKKLLVYRPVQKALLVRVGFYAMACLLFMILPVTLVRSLMNPDILLTAHLVSVLSDYWPILATGVMIIPFAIYDMLKVSNRVVGPIIRMRNEMARFVNGEEVDLVVLRQDDFWHDFAAVFNEVIDPVADDSSASVDQSVTIGR